MNRYFKKEPIPSNKHYSRKRIRGIAKLWADNEKEFTSMCSTACRIFDEKKDYTYVRSHFVEREINKCIDCGLIENGDKLATLLISKDIEMSKVGMEIVYKLREDRLNG